MNYFQIVKNVIDSWDPEGVFPYAENDAYEAAVMEIAPSILTASSIDEMTFIVHRGMNSTFGGYHYSECRPSAKRIWKMVHGIDSKNSRKMSFVLDRQKTKNIS